MKETAIDIDLQVSKSPKKLWKKIFRNYQLYIMLIPGILYIFIFCYIPMYGVQIAFRDYMTVKGFWGSEWVGLVYFSRFFNSPICGELIRNTLYLSLYLIVVGFPLPIILALLLNHCPSIGYRKFVQNVTYAPYFISTVVIVGMLMIMFSTNGPFTKLIELFGGQYDLFMGNPPYFRHIFVWSNIWQTLGWNSIIYIAVLSGINPELHESARVDGANKLKRMWHIDLPSILPTASILLILAAGGIMSIGFEKVYLMQNSMNLSVSEILSTYIYKQGLLNIDYSYSTAISLFNNVVNFTLLIIVNTFARRMSGDSLW